MLRFGPVIFILFVFGLGCTRTIILSPDEPEVEPGPDHASVELSIELVDFVESGNPAKRFRSIWRVDARESAGVAARIDFIRLEIWNRDADKSERTEIGGKRLVKVCGTSLVAASAEWTCEIPLDFNSDDLSGQKKFTFRIRDVFGNVFELTLDSAQ